MYRGLNIHQYLWKQLLHDSILLSYIDICCIFMPYSWNSLTRSRWDQRKYFELSEVWVKHKLSMILFKSIEVRFSMFRVKVHTSYNVDTDSVSFGECWSMKYTMNWKHYCPPLLRKRGDIKSHSSVCPSLCLSVRLSVTKTLTLAITFALLQVEPWYLACVFFVTRLFQWYHVVT